MKRLSVTVSLAILMWACGGCSRSSSPTSPSALTAPAAPRATYTLSGVVSEVTPTGPAPVEGARVEEWNLHLVATTDTNGFYSISGLYAGLTSVWVSTEGYETVRRDVTIDGDTRLDIQLVRR